MRKCVSHGSRDIAIHSSAHHAAAAKVAIRIPSIKLGIMTGGITLAVNLIMELPLLIRKFYKLHRQRKFNAISKVKMWHCIIEESSECFFVIIGSIAGAIIGQFLIPIPGVGALLGGLGGILLGQFIGSLIGYMIAKLFIQDKRLPTLPTIVCETPIPVD